MKHSGETTLDFSIERYKHNETGELATSVQMETNDWCDGACDYIVYTLSVSGTSYFTPGKFSGLPEDCYPDEGETEITSVVGPDGKDWFSVLTDSEQEQIQTLIEENVCEGLDDPEPDDYDDSFEDKDYEVDGYYD